MMTELQHFRIDRTRPNRVDVWIDVADRSMNVLMESVFDELHAVVDALSRKGTENPVVFRSAKRKGFVVGADLRRILAIRSDEEIQTFLEHGQRVLTHLEQYDAPTFALLQGPCLGGGLELALVCRFRIAARNGTQLGMPEAKLGLMPGWGGTQRLIELVGVDTGVEMLMTGESIDASRALDVHLVDALVDEPSLEAEIDDAVQLLRSSFKDRRPSAPDGNATPNTETLQRWAQFDGLRFGMLTPAQFAIREAIDRGIKGSRERGMEAERQLFFALLSSPQVQENLQRFANPSR